MKFLIAAMLVTLSGCAKDAGEVSDIALEVTPANARWNVEVVAKFRDSSAYNSYRRVYVLTDREAGKQYVGISGVGISEMGSHLVGKMQLEDER